MSWLPLFAVRIYELIHQSPFSNFIFFLYVLGEREYYERQFATLRSFEEVDSIESSHVIEDESVHAEAEQMQSERAMQLSNWANILLLAFKVLLFFILIELNYIYIFTSHLELQFVNLFAEDWT